MSYSLLLKAYRNKLQTRRLGMVLFVSLMSGCASDPPVLVLPSVESKPQTYRHKAAYNRPYKVRGKTYYPLTSPIGYRERGMASCMVPNPVIVRPWAPVLIRKGYLPHTKRCRYRQKCG